MDGKLRAAAEAALEALLLTYSATSNHSDAQWQAISALRAALAEPEVEQEPVYAFRRKGVSDDFVTCSKARHDELSSKPRLFETAIFYTAPPRRKWAPLTDEEKRLFSSWLDEKPDAEVFAGIEAVLKEKNT